MNLHPGMTGHPRNSLCLEHAALSARTGAYRPVAPEFILMEQPGVYQGDVFIFLWVRSALELENSMVRIY